MEACCLQSPLAEEVAHKLVLDDVEFDVSEIVKMAVKTAGDEEAIGKLTNAIAGLNQALTDEANRVGLTPVPGLPDPLDAAVGVAEAVTKTAPLLDSEEGKRELRREPTRFRGDAV